ncbi:MAG: hypothetical protein IPM82_12045 [Saprospiraceae bacterium]|nr:hypothetical protein [Saprospiraceae bacterium]
MEIIRVAAVTQLAVTQGEGAPEILKRQPATVYGAGCITMGIPLTVTFGLGEVGCA